MLKEFWKSYIIDIWINKLDRRISITFLIFVLAMSLYAASTLSNIKYPIALILMLFLSFGSFLLGGVIVYISVDLPKKYMMGDIELILEIIDKLFLDRFSEIDISNSFCMEELDDYIDINSIPNKETLYIMLSKVKMIRSKLVTVVPIIGLMIYKLLNTLLNWFSSLNLDIGLGISRVIASNTWFHQLLYLSWILLVYYIELYRIDERIIKIELLNQIKELHISN